MINFSDRLSLPANLLSLLAQLDSKIPYFLNNNGFRGCLLFPVFSASLFHLLAVCLAGY